MYQPLYWVLGEQDETIAICPDKKIADWIAEHYPADCKVKITISEKNA